VICIRRRQARTALHTNAVFLAFAFNISHNRAQPAAGHTDMTIGIEQFRQDGDTRLDRLLLQPLRESPSVYPLNRNPET